MLLRKVLHSSALAAQRYGFFTGKPYGRHHPASSGHPKRQTWAPSVKERVQPYMASAAFLYSGRFNPGLKAGCNDRGALRVLYKNSNRQKAYMTFAYKKSFSSLRQLISWVGRGLRFRVMPSGLKKTWSMPAARAPSMSHS